VSPTSEEGEGRRNVKLLYRKKKDQFPPLRGLKTGELRWKAVSMGGRERVLLLTCRKRGWHLAWGGAGSERKGGRKHSSPIPSKVESYLSAWEAIPKKGGRC